MNIPTIGEVFEFFQHYVFWFSLASNLLPPIEVFDPLPRVQKVYRVVVNLVSYYGALNWRGKIAAAYIARKNGGNSNDSQTQSGAHPHGSGPGPASLGGSTGR